MNDRLLLARQDDQYDDKVITTVSLDDNDGMMSVDFDGGWTLWIKRDPSFDTRATVAGDTLRCFGKGMGFTVRGIGLVVNGELVGLYRYETEKEELATHKATVRANNAIKLKKWREELTVTMERIRALPKEFQDRFEFFMQRKDWGWEFGFYELFCCEEAIKIVYGLDPTIPHKSKALDAYSRMSLSEQKRCIPDLSYDDHSGNTFGVACSLARALITAPETVIMNHGAMCGLTGCEDYGCWAARGK